MPSFKSSLANDMDIKDTSFQRFSYKTEDSKHPCSLLHLPIEIKEEVFSYLTDGECRWDIGFTCKSLFNHIYGQNGIIEVYQDGLHRNSIADERYWGPRSVVSDIEKGRIVKIEKRKISFADDLEQALKWKEVTFAIKCLIVCPVNVKERIMLKMIANREILGEKYETVKTGITMMILRDRNTSLDKFQAQEVLWLQEILPKIFESCPNIEMVYVNGCKLPSRCIYNVCKNVKLLDLGGCTKVNFILWRIAFSCFELRYLDLSRCSKITDYDLSCIGENCMGLEALNLNHCTKITCDGIIPIVQNCLRLKEMYLWDVGMTRKCHNILRILSCAGSGILLSKVGYAAGFSGV